MATQAQPVNKLAEYWEKHPELWFSATVEDDIAITAKYGHHFLSRELYEKSTFCDKQYYVCYVLLFDQIRQHVNRVGGIVYPLPQNFIQLCYINYDKFKADFTDFEFMFCLMPLRHTHSFEHVKFVLTESWSRFLETKSPAIKRYITATYSRYAKNAVTNDKENLVCYTGEFIPRQSIVFILDDRCTSSVIPELAMHGKSQCTSSVVLELSNTNIRNPGLVTHKLIQLTKNFIRTNKLETITLTVSLSGGVDSMVCTYLLWAIGQPFQALHINYSNRAECAREEELLRYWCGRLKCPLFIRRIQEINRPLCMSVEMREIYESYTYDIRFMAYHNLLAPVVMGHNRDDSIENIFTNIAHCRGYDNLKGMTPDSQINGVRVLRPLLDIPKTEIYEFASLVNIPHLVDSTPGWSQRGRIRDNIVPALVGWNPLMLDSLVALATTVGEMAGLLDELIPDVQSLSFTDLSRIPVNGVYWTKIFQKAGIQVTKKTGIQLLDRLGQLRANPGKPGTIKITLAKNIYLQLIVHAVNNSVTAEIKQV